MGQAVHAAAIRQSAPKQAARQYAADAASAAYTCCTARACCQPGSADARPNTPRQFTADCAATEPCAASARYRPAREPAA
jgi:hypothetical protein